MRNIMVLVLCFALILILFAMLAIENRLKVVEDMLELVGKHTHRVVRNVQD